MMKSIILFLTLFLAYNSYAGTQNPNCNLLLSPAQMTKLKAGGLDILTSKGYHILSSEEAKCTVGQTLEIDERCMTSLHMGSLCLLTVRTSKLEDSNSSFEFIVEVDSKKRDFATHLPKALKTLPQCPRD